MAINDDYQTFRHLVQSQVEEDMKSMPQSYLENSWIVRCYRSRTEFESTFSDSQKRSEMLEKLTAIFEWEKETKKELAEFLNFWTERINKRVECYPDSFL
jgi:hypothetical protein